MADSSKRKSFPGKGNDVYTPPTPQKVERPPVPDLGQAESGPSGGQKPPTQISPDVGQRVAPLSLAYGTTPAGATRGNEPKWGATSGDTPQPNKDYKP